MLTTRSKYNLKLKKESGEDISTETEQTLAIEQNKLEHFPTKAKFY